MKPAEIARRRLAAQHLVDPPATTPRDIVGRLGAVQAQDYHGAKWALALRGAGLDEARVERAMTDGDIVRTHVLRPTWHFVSPADIRWMLALTGPRILAGMGGRHRGLELDQRTLTSARRTIERVLGGGCTLTRTEIASALAVDGIATDGQRIAHVLMDAELQGLICSGPLRGKQFTYALLEERVPPAAAPLPRDEAVVELVHRYFATHGPATAHDFAWWSGLTTSDARRGVEALGKALARAETDGITYWYDPAFEPAPAGQVHLLPNYDEQFIGFRDRTPLLALLHKAGAELHDRAIFSYVLMVDGQFAGEWRRTVRSAHVQVELLPSIALTRAQRRAAAQAAEAYGAYLGLDAKVSMPAHSSSSIT